MSDAADVRRQTGVDHDRFVGNPVRVRRYLLGAHEPLIVMLPAGHRLTERETITPQELAEEIYVSSATASPAVDAVVKRYAEQAGIHLKPKFDAGSLSATISVVVSCGGVTLIPAYAEELLSPNVVARPLTGTPPKIELNLGYNPANCSHLLRTLLSRKEKIVRAK